MITKCMKIMVAKHHHQPSTITTCEYWLTKDGVTFGFGVNESLSLALNLMFWVSCIYILLTLFFKFQI